MWAARQAAHSADSCIYLFLWGGRSFIRKGLEFPHVHIVGLEDGLMPHTRSKVEGTMDEERRLFYVAITRAMLTLTLSHCGGRKKYGTLEPRHPSPFLGELPGDLIENDDENDWRYTAPNAY